MKIVDAYQNAKVMSKSMISPIFMTLMLTVLLVTTFINLNNVIKSNEEVVYNLAPDSELAAQVMDGVYNKRLQVKDYIKTSADSAKENFKQFSDSLDKLIEQARQEMHHPERAALLMEIENLNHQYDETFYNEVVKKTRLAMRLLITR